MGMLTETDIIEYYGREDGLSVHLRANFYPPLPENHKKVITEAFKEHWAGELEDHEELAQRCYLRDLQGLYRYFDSFLNERDDF